MPICLSVPICLFDCLPVSRFNASMNPGFLNQRGQNSCWLLSFLTILSALPGVAETMGNHECHSTDCLFSLVAGLLRQEKSSTKAVCLKKARETLQKICHIPQKSMHDVAEFFRKFLDWPCDHSGPGSADNIRQQFVNRYTSTVVCSTCNAETKQNEVIYQRNVSNFECIESMMKSFGDSADEIPDYVCKNCNARCSADSKRTIRWEQPPTVLALQFLTWSKQTNTTKKLVPLLGEKRPGLPLKFNMSGKKFGFRGVSIHCGQNEANGHYVSVVAGVEAGADELLCLVDDDKRMMSTVDSVNNDLGTGFVESSTKYRQHPVFYLCFYQVEGDDDGSTEEQKGHYDWKFFMFCFDVLFVLLFLGSV